MKTKGNCLVLGANGFIGRNLCKRLSNEYFIRAFSRNDNCNLKSCGVDEFIAGDFTLIKDFNFLLEDVDIVFHLISTTLPKAGSENLIDEELCDNVIPTIRLLESLKGRKIKLIFASSGGTVYGDNGKITNLETDNLNPKCTYGLQKKLIEDCIQFYRTVYGIDCRIVRISNPYGVGQREERLQGVIPIFINRLIDDMPITVFGVNSVRNYIYMDDLTEILEKLCAYNGKKYIFNIGSDESYTLLEVISTIESVVGKKFSDVSYEERRSFDVERAIPDSTEVFRELGWRAEVSLLTGVKLTYDKIIKNRAAQRQ